MQKISFGDKEYVKASEIAKRFKYTQDYVGQLCRGKKVEARLVGRTWYVVPESVTSYRKTKHKTQKAVTAATKQVSNRASKNKIAVVPVIRGKTAKILRAADTAIRTPTSKTTIVSTKYSQDTTAHIPIVTTKAVTLTVPEVVELRSDVLIKKAPLPKRIKVVPHSKKKTVLQAEKVPEIILSAKLEVGDGFEEMAANNAANSSQQSTITAVPTVRELKQVEQSKQEQTGFRINPATQQAREPKLLQKKQKSSKIAIIRDWMIVAIGVVCAIGILAASSSIIVGTERITSTNFSLNQVVNIVVSFLQ